MALARAGLLTEEQLLGDFAGIINAVTLSPGRQLRSAIDMSRLALFVDAAASIDRTAWPNLFISYYTYGSAIGFALDLSLRDRSDGAVSGDDYMRAVWQRFGRTPSEPGMVATPYTIADLEAVLAQVSGDRTFARDFFARYVEGRELVDYARLLKRAGLIVRRPQEGRPTMGSIQLAAGAAQSLLEALTFDVIHSGSEGSELTHDTAATLGSYAGELGPFTVRDIRTSQSYTTRVNLPSTGPCSIAITYWGGEFRRHFTVRIGDAELLQASSWINRINR